MITTSEKGLSVLDAVAMYKELTEVESGFRQLKDVLAMRPIYHQIEPRVKAHIFVAALALAGPTTAGPPAQRGGGGRPPRPSPGRKSPPGPSGWIGLDSHGLYSVAEFAEFPDHFHPASAL